MVQQTTDSKFSEYGLAKTETGLLNPDKQPQVAVSAKRTALRDTQNENTSAVPRTVTGLLFPKENTAGAAKMSGSKRSQPECLLNPSLQQCPTNNAGNAHLVYVRRKPEVEVGRSAASDAPGDSAPFSQVNKVSEPDETTQQKAHITEQKISVLEDSFNQRTSLVSISSSKHSGSPPLAKSNNMTTPKLNQPQGASANPLDNSRCVNTRHWEEQYCRLQNLLKKLDQSKQEDYMQMLRSLSSVELSRHAVELEKRSIQLSLEEAKEIQRVNFLDLLGKYPKNSKAP